MSELTEADIKKLKVVELKSELTNRGLATTGNKAVLVARLIEFVEESQNEEDEGGDTEPDEAEDTPVVEEEKPVEEIAEPTVVAEPMEDAPDEEKEPQVEESSEMEASEEPTSNEEVKEEESMDSSEPSAVEAAATEPEAAEPEAAEPVAAEPESAEPEAAEPEAAEPEAAEPVAAEPAAADEKSEAMDTEASADKKDEAGTTVDESKGNNTHSDESKEATGEEKMVDAETPKKDTTPKKTEERRSLNSRPPVSQKPPPPEDKGLELEEGVVAIDFFNSDVWMKIEDKGMTGSNRVESGFSQLWACGRTTYGFDSDKVCFAVKLKEKLECRIFENFGVEKCQFRVGVSVQTADMVLGMDDLSVAIDNFGKQYVEGSKGEAYYEKEKEGGRLDKDDIITVAIDTTENTVSFFKNKEQLGEAPITLPEGMRGQSLFPTIGTRNMPFTLITAATAEETFTPEGYTFIQEFEGKVRGPLAPVSREECEVVMMVGFPGSGKSTYVKKLVQDNPDKHYNILGTSYILKRMSDAVEARKKAKGGRIGYGMVNHAENMLRIVFDLAGRRARNFIIDQHNCQSAAQRRKLGYFNGGYKRRAVMIIPTEDVLKERVAGVPESEKPEDIPSDLHHEMKAYLTVPYIPEQVAEIEYVDGTEEEIKERVKKYNSDGQEYLKTHRKRRSFNGPRGGGRGYHNNNYHNNSPYRGGNQRYNNNNSGGGGYRDNRYSPYGNRGGYGGGGGYRGGYGGGGGGGGGYGGGNRGGYGGNYRGGYHNNNQGGGGGYQGGGGGGYQQQSGYRGNNRGSYRGKW